MIYADINNILDELAKKNNENAKELLEKLQKILENSGDTSEAFKAYERDFWDDFKEFYNKVTKQNLSTDELKNIRAGQITLSAGLYARLGEVKSSVNAIISKAKKENKSVNELSKMLYEGYNFKADPLKVKTKFPKYLWQECAEIKIKNIKTPALRASYTKALKSIIKQENLKALKIAGYEKARYYAQRIALNETSRAYNDNRALEYASDKDIKVVKIKMSKTHPRTDICDYFANVDKYGLGAGVYPKDKAPIPPFHPFCRCAMIPKYADEYSTPKLNKNADKEYLEGLKDWQKARVLGSKAKADEAMKTGDIKAIFNAMKPERYKVKEINEIIKAGARNSKNSTQKAPKNEFFNSGIKPDTKSYKDENAKNIAILLDKHKVEYIAPKMLKTKLSDDEIIAKISGGDETNGSCYSVALAYMANKAGYDVRDFRGGYSQKIFSDNAYNIDKIFKIEPFKLNRIEVISALNNAEEGKECLLKFGRHAAIIRKYNSQLQYLELQSKKQNGFKPLDAITLTKRFLNKNDRKTAKYFTSVFDAKILYNNDDFKKLIGYFNTNKGFEMKGENGDIK